MHYFRVTFCLLGWGAEVSTDQDHHIHTQSSAPG
jgi:hypothetical protein